MNASPPDIAAVVLAAGQGKRMASDLPKVLHPVAGRPMLGHVLDRLGELGVGRTVVIVGHGREAVIEHCSTRGVAWAVQEPQLGTGHAFRQAVPVLGDFRGTVLVLCGDTPLLRTETLRTLLDVHADRRASATVLSADLDDPSGYGRVVRDDHGDIERIVEEKDASAGERALHEINTAIYVLAYPEILDVLGGLTADNRQGEYYLTDVVHLLRGRGRRVAVHKLADAREALGVNTAAQLAEAEAAWHALHGGRAR